MRTVILALMITTGLAGAVPVSAATETFDFTGNCAACDGGYGSVAAQLVLQDYIMGDPILRTNFVSFRFDGGPNQTFAVDRGNQFEVSGEMGGAGSPATFFGLNDPNHYFFSFGGGFWAAGAPGQAAGDYGFSHLYTVASAPISAAPEPAAWALMILGVGLAGAGLRRRTRTTVGYA